MDARRAMYPDSQLASDKDAEVVEQGNATQPERPGRARSDAPVKPYEAGADMPPQGKLDQLVLAELAAKGVRPARTCSDEVFLRRAYLDIAGIIPTIEEAHSFLADRDPAKRTTLIDVLMARDEFADYWAMKWCDVLRVKSEFPINLWPNAVQAYHRWIRACVRENRPYDRFARDLLTTSGSNFRDPAVNFYRAMSGRSPETIARTVALTLMGARAERWSKARLTGLSTFFSRLTFKPTGEWKEEIVVDDASSTQRSLSALLPDGSKATVTPGIDPRRTFANWLIAPTNPWFARAAVNRVWAWLMGRGIVHEPDDIRPDNPPSNPALLSYLEREFVAMRYDVRRLMRLILTSATYQRSSIPRSPGPASEALFGHYPVRRLDAELLIDAINKITGATDSYSSPIPEPFTFLPESARAVQIADGSITSAFLELFGRPARDTGLVSERNARTTAAQRLHMLNSSHIQRKLERGPGIGAVIRFSRSPAELLSSLYLKILSRPPTEEERAAASEIARAGTQVSREEAMDLTWSLVNSAEFLCRH